MSRAKYFILNKRYRLILHFCQDIYGDGLIVAGGNREGIVREFRSSRRSDPRHHGQCRSTRNLHALGVNDSPMVTISSNADVIPTVSTGRADAYAAASLTASGFADQSDAGPVVNDHQASATEAKV